MVAGACHGKFFVIIAVDSHLLLVAVRCRRCDGLFATCRPCYREQRCCSRACSTAARTKTKRLARARHQKSPEGAADHRDRNRVYRAQQKARRVMDHNRQEVAHVRKLCLPPPGPGILPATVAPQSKEAHATDVYSPSTKSPSLSQCAHCQRWGPLVARWPARRQRPVCATSPPPSRP